MGGRGQLNTLPHWMGGMLHMSFSTTMFSSLSFDPSTVPEPYKIGLEERQG
jgi:hypothetical protein